MYERLPPWLQELLPILILVAVVALVIRRLPKVELGHTPAYVRRRTLNWFPIGMTYAFLYMGRYNLTVAKSAFGDAMTKDDFGTIFGWGALVYGLAFLLNGPLADRWGGRATILISAGGSAVANLMMGWVVWAKPDVDLVTTFSVLYGLNMYFQSFGAVSVVKVNAPWFHVRERGVFGGVFGILISLGIYFAYDWGGLIVENLPVEWVFFIPAAIIAMWFVVDALIVVDHPSQAGFVDLDTGDATSGQTGHVSLVEVVRKMVTNPIILTIAGIEFCSGFLRNAMMQWGDIFGKEVGLKETFAFDNWGLLMCVGGIVGGTIAGIVSDRVFGSRRAPVAAVLYGGVSIGLVVMWATLDTVAIGWVLLVMLACVVSVHGMLSGTASMDFGGAKNAGIAVGLIDACVYLGTTAQSWGLKSLLPSGPAQSDPANWTVWPLSMMPLAVIGLLLSLRIWNAMPKPRAVKVTVPAADEGAEPATPRA